MVCGLSFDGDRPGFGRPACSHEARHIAGERRGRLENPGQAPAQGVDRASAGNTDRPMRRTWPGRLGLPTHVGQPSSAADIARLPEDPIAQLLNCDNFRRSAT
jgi:hypothetical protein